MENDKKVYDLCGSENYTLPMLYRAAFIARICGISTEQITDIKTLPKEIVDNISEEKYSDTFARLLILYGAGYVSKDIVLSLSANAEKYRKEIIAAENAAMNSQKEDISEDVIQNILITMINAKKYSEINGTDFDNIRKLCDNKYTKIKNGFVYVKSKDFLTLLANCNEKMGYLHKDEIKVLGKEDILNEFSGSENSLEDVLDEISVEKPSTLPFLLNLNNAVHIIDIYDKPYAVEFINYAKENNLEFDNDFCEKFTEYIRKTKMNFTIHLMSRKRRICNEVNYFDYAKANWSENDKKLEISEDNDKIKNITLEDDVSKKELGDEALLEMAKDKLLRNNAIIDDTVIEIEHCNHKYLYVCRNNKLTQIDSDTFHTIPFDYNNIWTTVMEWSKQKKIKKKGDKIIVSEEEWNKIDKKDRCYAEHMIEEQYVLMKKENTMLKTLSELIQNAGKEKEKNVKKPTVEGL